MIKQETLALKMNQKLTYDGQLVFKRFLKKNLKFNEDFYFDDVFCVDGKTSKNIPGVWCNGSITWQKAYENLKHHFNVA